MNEIFNICPSDKTLGVPIFDESGNFKKEVPRYGVLAVYETNNTPLLVKLINKCIANTTMLYIHCKDGIVLVEGNYWQPALRDTGIPY